MQENMLQQHFSKYDEEILDLPQNPNSIPCSCFVVAQREQGMANLQHHTANAHEQASFPLPPSDTQLQLATPPTDTNTSPTATTGDNRSQHQHVVMEEVEQRVCEEEAEEEEGEGERGRLQAKMDVRSTLRSTLVDEVRQFSCYSNDTLLHLNSHNPTIFSLI